MFVLSRLRVFYFQTTKTCWRNRVAQNAVMHSSFNDVVGCGSSALREAHETARAKEEGRKTTPKAAELTHQHGAFPELNACRSTRTSAVMAARLSLPRYIATMLAQQVIALQTELHRPKPL